MITFTSKWIRLSDFPTSSYGKEKSNACIKFWKDLTNGKYSGVYQVSLSKPKAIIHKDIGYIGRSADIATRISDIRTGTGKNNTATHHMCGVYLREEEVDINSVYIRVLLSTDINGLEKSLQFQHRDLFGYDIGYAWEEASGGYKSCRIQSQVNIKRLNSVEACMKVQKVLSKRIQELKTKQK